MTYRFIQDNAEEYGVGLLCEAFGVSRGGYYEWLRRGPSPRAKEDEAIKERIGHYHAKSSGSYGYRPIWDHLRDEGVDCGRDRALRLMREMEIEGWSVSNRNDADLACEAMRNAALTRGVVRSGILAHSDRGSTYASSKYRRLLDSYGMVQSMSGKGNCYDNAAMESFFGRFKTAFVRGRTFSDEGELRSLVFKYIEPFYNRFRKHSGIGCKSPVQFEQEIAAKPLGACSEQSTNANN